MVNLKQIKSALAVVQTGSVNRAAEGLCLAPSSVSAQLRDLSASIGVSLFEPSGRGLVLSAAGRQLLPKFQQMLLLDEQISAAAQVLVNEPAGELRLYAPSSMCIYRLPPLIEALQALAPSVELHLQHDPFDYQQALVDRGIEAAILVQAQPDIAVHGYQAVAREEVIYVAHPSLVVEEELSPKQLSLNALITTEAQCSYRMAAERHFKQHKLQLTPRQSFSNVEVIRRCLLAKMGVGLLPRCVVAEDLSSGRLRQQKVEGAPYCFKSMVVWPREAEISPRLKMFLQVVRAQQSECQVPTIREENEHECQ